MTYTVVHIIISIILQLCSSRNVRAGSEAKSTPPATKKRVTRASSVDPVINLNESVGTPVKRRTRASLIPAEPTVPEEQSEKTKAQKSLENTVVELDEEESGKMTILNFILDK